MEKIKDTLLVVDAYLSDKKRSESCLVIINQLKEKFPNYSILLINKSSKSFNLQKEVDYYLNLSNSFLVGYPPKDILDSERYERPYVYVSTPKGTFENWMPLTGVTDHVAGIYNSFLLTAKFAKSLGYKKVFKVEYDTEFNSNDLSLIKTHVDSFKDYLFYGKRQEGEYAKKHHYLIDVHFIGYSVDLFQGFSLVNNDDDFWELCKKINYYGKWIEYIIPSIVYYQKHSKNKVINGIDFPGIVTDRFPNSSFDKINSPSWWTEKWKNLPLPCKIKYQDNTIDENKIELFSWNDKDYPIDIEVKIFKGNKIIKEYKNVLYKKQWASDSLIIDDTVKIISKVKENNIESYTSEHIIDKNKIKQLNIALKVK